MLKSILAALLAYVPMTPQALKVDHVTIAGRDLGAMRRALQAAGLPSEDGGPHSNHATEMALTSFPDGSYLELIAIQAQADPAALAAHAWAKFLTGDAGPCAWAIRATDLGADRIKSGRRRPDGVQLEWETAENGASHGTFFPFLIHDLTPRELRVYPSGKPLVTNLTGVTKVYLAVKDLDAAVGQFERAYALPAPARSDDRALGARVAWFKGTPVVLVAPLTPQSWLAERLHRFGEGPCAFVLGRGKAHKEISWLDLATLGWHLGLE